MPNKYQRKITNVRAEWSEQSLKLAINAVKNEGMSVLAASKNYKIPRKTLERRIKKGNYKKGPLGPSSTFGQVNERKLASHIRNLQEKRFPLTINDVRRIAFKFAEQLHLSHRFNRETEQAGYGWLNSFLCRNKDITLKKSVGGSLIRPRAMNRVEINEYFDLLEKILINDNGILTPNRIFNVDNIGLLLNNCPGHALAKKGSSTEKGETITLIACCNAEGTFLPPACIMKDKNKKAEFEKKMPSGSVLFTSQKSAHITSDIFIEWLKVHFVPRKPAGKVVLLIDGHSTHCNSVEMFDYANENDIILISMPSHTSHFLQPLDHLVFKALKTHFNEQCQLWLQQHPTREITKSLFGTLLNKAWIKAATPGNAISSFEATGVFPFNPTAIPDHAFIDEFTKFESPDINEVATAV